MHLAATYIWSPVVICTVLAGILPVRAQQPDFSLPQSISRYDLEYPSIGYTTTPLSVA